MYNLHSKWILRKSFFYTNTHTETFTSLVCSVINDALLKAMPAIPLCWSVHVINFPRQTCCWISMQILQFTGFRSGCWSHRPDEINVCVSHFRRLKWETGTEAVCTHWADTLFHWKIKNSQQISHMTGRSCSVRSMLW